MRLRLDTRGIAGWDSFHAAFAALLGFPEFYGANMDAWIDCMTYVGDPESGMTSVRLAEGEDLVLEVSDVEEFRARCPAPFDALIAGCAAVNQRAVEAGADPNLLLLLL